VIGPKDMPLAMRTAGRWIGKLRRVSNHFRAGVETMIREAEMEEMEKKWQAQNKRVLEEHPNDEVTAAMAGGGQIPADTSPLSDEPPSTDKSSAAEARADSGGGDDAAASKMPGKPAAKEPQLPFGGAASKP
jgi:sec-independent protein translocase protein TatB